MSFDMLVAEAEKLSADDRVRLIEVLEAGLVDENAPISPALAAELDRRIADMEENPDDEMPWDEYYAKLKRELGSP